MPPQNAHAISFSSPDGLTIKWRQVPSHGLNGLLRHYVLKYQVYSVARVRDFEAEKVTIIVNQTKLRYTIKNAKSYATYKIEIAARNTLGIGPFAKFYGGE